MPNDPEEKIRMLREVLDSEYFLFSQQSFYDNSARINSDAQKSH
jgi:hypothetical protein